MEKISQWHETSLIKEDGVVTFLKKYEPDSYEIKNELSWLTSNLFSACSSFRVPRVKEASIENGYVKMEGIDVSKTLTPTKQEMLNYLIEVAGELHSILQTHEPKMRNSASAEEYNGYVTNFAKHRIDIVKSSVGFEKEVSDWIYDKIKTLRNKYFSIVHRDLRFRHLLFSKDNKKPTLIDWEFSNISHPAQDLAKLVYDTVVNYDLEYEDTVQNIVSNYSYITKQSTDEVENNVRVFLPIMPLEHCASFLRRKPKGYEEEVSRDLAYLSSLYEEEKK